MTEEPIYRRDMSDEDARRYEQECLAALERMVREPSRSRQIRASGHTLERLTLHGSRPDTAIVAELRDTPSGRPYQMRFELWGPDFSSSSTVFVGPPAQVAWLIAVNLEEPHNDVAARLRRPTT